MLNNDILRRLRFALDLPDEQVVEMFTAGGATVDAPALARFLLREDEVGFVELSSSDLDAFLDGLIAARRGKREGPPPPPIPLNNNVILRKLKIALNLREDDMLEIFAKAGFHMGRGELSALFRSPSHKNYRYAGDQAVRNFLQGLSKTLRPASPARSTGSSGRR